MRTRDNLSSLVASADRKRVKRFRSKPQVGKVFAVVTTQDTPTKELYRKAGGNSGTIFYLDYDDSKNIDIKTFDLFKCKIASPFYSDNQNYPLVGELVHILELPSFSAQTSPNNSPQKYYLGPINIWDNPQQNSLTTDNLGKTFTENKNIKYLISFEGDRIYLGRKGNGLRFGSTVSSYSDISEWSRNGRPDGDPITILVNGYVTSDTGSLTPNIEEVNKEMSSIYMTSTQTIPLIPGASIINPINSSLLPSDYTNSQIILNSDRVTINSKKDEVLLFAKTNMELSTDNIINLNAGEYIHINSDKILLGTKANNTVPDEPVLLGNQTVLLLEQIILSLNALGSYLSSAVVPTSDGAMAIPAVNDAGAQLLSDMTSACDKLLKITSDKVFTV